MNITSPALMSKTNYFQSPLTELPNAAFPLLLEESCEVSSSSQLNGYNNLNSPPNLLGMNTDLETPSFHISTGTELEFSFWNTLGITPSSTVYPIPTSSTPSVTSLLPHNDGNSLGARDDLSPASSINSSFSTVEPSEKKKKGNGPRLNAEECLVCGDRASGYHYNALTCEGCKGFFRRSITKKAVYSCKYGGQCEMDMYMRRKCQECRFKKCIAMGMRQECVVPENTCQQKREQKRARVKDKVVKTEPLTPNPHIDTPCESFPGLPAPLGTPGSMKPFGRVELTKEHEELINRLIINQDEYESPLELNLKNIYPSDTVTDASFSQITEMTKLTVELIVKFALNAPGFVNIPVTDQVTLLKACSSELIMLRASRRYHPSTDSIVFANNTPCTRQFYISAGMEPSTTDSLFDFCKKLAEMKVDNAEYALLSGITLFSERPHLMDAKGVEVIQFLYVETLYAYVTNKWYPKNGTAIARLLDILTQLRTLGVMNSEQVLDFDTKGKQLPDILRELWDMDLKR